MSPVDTNSLLQSVNIALTDEHLSEIEAGRADVFLDENRGVVYVRAWDSNDPDEPARVYTVEARRLR